MVLGLFFSISDISVNIYVQDRKWVSYMLYVPYIYYWLRLVQ